MAIIVGSVGVTIYPDTGSFWSRFKAGTQAGGEKAARDLADTLSSRISPELQRAVAQGVNSPAPRRAGRQAGQAYGDEFGRTVTTRMEAAIKAIPDRVTLNAHINTVGAATEIEALKAQLKSTNTQLKLGLIDDTAAMAKIEEVRLNLERLSATSPDIRVRVNAGKAVAELAAIQAAVDKLDGSVVKLNDSLGDDDAGGGGGGSGGKGMTSRWMRILKIVALLGPALIPLLSVAAVGVGALTVGLTAAGIGLLGIIQGIDQVGKLQVNAALDDLNEQFKLLEYTTAHALAPELAQGMEDLKQQIPSLLGPLAILSGDIGRITANLGIGLVSVLRALIPDAIGLADALVRITEGWRTAGQSEGFQAFLAYTHDRLPAVLEMLGALGTAFGHLVLAAEPWGTVVLGAIRVFSDALAAIPLPVLTTLVTMLEIVALRGILLKAMAGTLGLVARGVTAISTALMVAAATGTPALLQLAVAAAPLVATFALVAAAAYGLTHMTVQLIDLKKNYGNLTDALLQDNLAIGQNVTNAIKAEVQASSLSKAVLEAGVSYDTMANQITGSDDSFKSLLGTLDKHHELSLEQLTDLVAMREGYQRDAADAARQKVLADQRAEALYDSAKAYKTVSDAMTISVEQAKEYGDSLGLVAENMDKSQGYARGAAAAIEGLSQAYATANTSQAALLDATIAYGKSAHTAADQATFLGASLIAAQGDALSYGSALAGAFGATRTFAEQFKGDADAQKGLRQFADSLHGVDLRTADVTTQLAIFSQTSAPAVTQGLTTIQTAAGKAAEATYLHYLATEGQSKAVEESARVFNTVGHDALVGAQKDLGLTDQQVQDLTQNLLSVPPTTAVEVIANGLADINKTLQDTAVALANLNGKHYTTFFDLQYDAGALSQVQAAMNSGYLDSLAPPSAFGNIFPGITPFANGGAMIGHKLMFAEPETQGEAFIPFAADRRPRATSILGVVANKFGFELTPKGYEGGSASYSQAPASSGNGPTQQQLTALIGVVAQLGDRFDKAIDDQTDTLRLQGVGRQVNN